MDVLKGRNLTVSTAYGKGGQITFDIDNDQIGYARRLCDELRGKVFSVVVKLFRKKRSLDANAYCFALIDKLAEKLNITTVDVYRNAIKEIGGVSEIVCAKDESVKRLCGGWEQNGLGWQTDILPSKIEGCSNVVLYYGSSTYDSAQMSRLIDNIIEECKLQGISTDTPDEIEKMKVRWRDAEVKANKGA